MGKSETSPPTPLQHPLARNAIGGGESSTNHYHNKAGDLSPVKIRNRFGKTTEVFIFHLVLHCLQLRQERAKLPRQEMIIQTLRFWKTPDLPA